MQTLQQPQTKQNPGVKQMRKPSIINYYFRPESEDRTKAKDIDETRRLLLTTKLAIEQQAPISPELTATIINSVVYHFNYIDLDKALDLATAIHKHTKASIKQIDKFIAKLNEE